MRKYKMIIRKTTLNDAEGLLVIRNNENIYKFFKSNKPVSLNNHIKWLNTYLLNEKNQYLISEEVNGIISGYIRKDHIKNNDYEVSIAINESFQKQGIAGKLLKELLLHSNKDENIYAEIQKINIASINFFKKNGFNFYKSTKNYEILIYKCNK